MDGYIKNSSKEINMYFTLYFHVASPSFMRERDHFYAMSVSLSNATKRISVHIDLRLDYDTCNAQERTRFKSTTHEYKL